MIELKSERELALMRKAGRIVAEVLHRLEKRIRPGVKTADLDRFSDRLIQDLGGKGAFRGYKGYPAAICTSINEVIVHGIPGKKSLAEGDIISVDVGVEVGGYFADGARTYAVGRIDGESERLIGVTRSALEKAIAAVKVGNSTSDISRAIQEFVESNGFNVIRVFVGHGIGSKLHEPPEVPNFWTPGRGTYMENGMTLAIEPMVSAGDYEAEILDDGWTAATRDKSRVAHFEHTVAITNDGPEVLTLWQRKSR